MSLQPDVDEAVTGLGTIGLASACGALWDVVVIGAGPAGALVSRRAALSGMRVLLIDRQAFPRDKVCGGCLSARTLAALDEAGVGDDVAGLGGHPLHGVRLGGWGRAADLSLPGGLSISRRALDATLVSRAVAAGAQFLPGYRADIGPRHVGRREVILRAPGGCRSTASKVVIDASGLGSELLGRRSGGSAGSATRIGCCTVIEGPASAYRTGIIYMAVGAGGYVGAVRLEDGRLNVAAAFDPRLVRRRGPGAAAQVILRDAGFAAIAEIVDAPWRGTPGLGQRPRRRATDRVFAVGDAAGYVEPFTGEGIGWAAESAAMLAPIVERAVEGWSGDLTDRWTDEYRRGPGRSQRACRAVAWVLRRPLVARAAISALGRRPGLGDSFVRRLQAAPVADGGAVWP